MGRGRGVIRVARLAVAIAPTNVGDAWVQLFGSPGVVDFQAPTPCPPQPVASQTVNQKLGWFIVESNRIAKVLPNGRYRWDWSSG